MQLSADMAALIGFPCEAVLWGVNCMLFLTSLVVLQQDHFREYLRTPVIYLNCLIFLCCTTHFALEFNHYYTTLYSIGVTNYSSETTALIAADFLISFTDLVGDLVLIYRCWTLWGKKYHIVIVPLLTAIGGFACICGVTSLVVTTDPTAPSPPAAIVPLGLAGYTLPLCTNAMVTCLIVYRLWSCSHSDFIPNNPFQTGQSPTWRAMMLIVESGLLYLLFQLVFVILFAVDNNAEAILAVMTVQIYGIAPTLIVVRVGLGLSPDHVPGIDSGHTPWIVRRGSGTSEMGCHQDRKVSELSTQGRDDREREVKFSGSEEGSPV